ncbi:MAG: hypothetical protein KAS71_06435 [Bacteroidales bacterium]|nr:hypothetical protein [Bacteroidales bacterium]
MDDLDFRIINVESENSENQELIFEGDIGIYNAVEIQNELKKINFNSPNVQITLRKIETMDLASIQIILSLRKSLDDKASKLSIVSELSDDIMSLVRKTGFEQIMQMK